MSDFLFSIGAAFDVGQKPQVTIAFPPGTHFRTMPIEIAMSFVNEVNAQIVRLMPPQQQAPRLVGEPDGEKVNPATEERGEPQS